MSKKKNKKSIHFVTNNKGGVGKSFVSSVLAQYFNCVAFDIDISNKTLTHYKGLKIHEGIPTYEQSEYDNETSSYINDVFKVIFSDEKIQEETNLVFDIGSSMLIPFVDFAKKWEVFDELRGLGFDVYIHTIIVGGQEFQDTIESLDVISDLVVSDKEPMLYIWKNQYNHTIDTTEIMKQESFSKIEDNFLDFFTITNQHPLTKKNLSEYLLEDYRTFDEVEKDENIFILDKKRVLKYKQEIYSELDQIFDVKNKEDKDENKDG